jgi:hypothetical protein
MKTGKNRMTRSRGRQEKLNKKMMWLLVMGRKRRRNSPNEERYP